MEEDLPFPSLLDSVVFFLMLWIVRKGPDGYVFEIIEVLP